MSFQDVYNANEQPDDNEENKNPVCLQNGRSSNHVKAKLLCLENNAKPEEYQLATSTKERAMVNYREDSLALNDKVASTQVATMLEDNNLVLREKNLSSERNVMLEDLQIVPHNGVKLTEYKAVEEKNLFFNVVEDVNKFKNLVYDLGQIIEVNAIAPTGEARTKILMGAAEDLACKIQNQLVSIRQGIDRMDSATAKTHLTSYQKTKTDFRQSHNIFHGLMGEFRKKQQQSSDATNLYGADSTEEEYGDENMLVVYGDRELVEVAEKREDEYNEQVRRERNDDLVEINKKMHTVNSIYKDLGYIVNSQGEKIDAIENSTNVSSGDVRFGVENLEEANRHVGVSSISNPLHEGKKTSAVAKNPADDGVNWMSPFATIHEDMEEVGRDLNTFMKKSFKNLRLARDTILNGCTVPDHDIQSP